MPFGPDLRDTEEAIVGPVNTGLMLEAQPEAEAPGALDTLAAAARQSNVGGALYERLNVPNPDLPDDAPEGWDALDHIQGFEDDAGEFTDVQNPSELQGIKDRLTARRQDMQTLARAGGPGFATSLAFGLVDPSFLAASAVPEITMAKNIRLAKTLTAAARGTAGAGGYEAELQALQTGRTMTETMYNLGGGAILAGVLGHLLHRIPPSASAKLRQAIDAETEALVRSEAGAAAVARPTTLAAETIGRGAGGMSKALGKTPLIGTDLDVIMGSDSIVARTTLQDLADVPQALAKNEAGIATPASVEAAVGRHEARIADFIDTARDLWAKYRARVPRGERMNKSDFMTSVASASRRGDKIGVPEIDEAARFLRARVFDPLKKDAQELGLFAAQKEGGEGGKLVGAESYFRRMYDRNVIRANLNEWHNVLRQHFMRDGKANAAEVAAAVEDVTKKILHADVGTSNWSTQVTVPTAGPLQSRTLDIPDELIERFLVNDPIRVSRSYVRDLAPQVEVARRFGDVEMKDRISAIQDDYNIKREKVRATDASGAEKNKALKHLSDQETATLEALVRVRDRVLHRAGRADPNASKGTRAAIAFSQGWRNIVASAKLGVTAITGGLMDTAKVAAQYGFLPTVSKLAKLVASPEYRALSRGQARRVGSAVEAALSRRVQVAFDGAITEGWTDKLAHGVYKYTGLNHITDFNRTLSATLFEDSVLKAARKIADGQPVGQFARTRLASLGLGDDEMKAIAKEIEKHGAEVDGIRVSGSADWDNKALADIYDAAILKESKITVQQPGAADRVWWMDKELGKFIGQLKTFSLSGPTRLLAGGLQMAGQGEYARAARFFGFMMIGGYLTHSLRQTIAGKTPTTAPVAAAGEALTESGIAGVFPDLFSPVGRRLGIFGESVRMSDRNAFAAYGGPALGAIVDTYDFAFNRTAGGISASDLHMLRRMLPFQNVWYLRRAINALEGESAEAMGLKGATNEDFIGRVLKTDAMQSSSQRGGTGTGVPAQ